MARSFALRQDAEVTRITLLDDGSTSGAAALGALRTPREAGWDGPTRLFTMACTRDGDAPPTPIQGPPPRDDAVPERP